MFDIHIKEIKLDKEAVDKLLSKFWKFWLGIPRFLRVLVVAACVSGAVYYLYNRISISYDIESLHDEVHELTNKYKQAIIADRYLYDIQNVVVSVKTIERQIDAQYQTRMELLEVFKRYMLEQHPGDRKAIQELERIQKQAEFEKGAYDKIIQHQLDLYEGIDESDKLINDIINSQDDLKK